MQHHEIMSTLAERHGEGAPKDYVRVSYDTPLRRTMYEYHYVLILLCTLCTQDETAGL